jgi:hypothetical protein
VKFLFEILCGYNLKEIRLPTFSGNVLGRRGEDNLKEMYTQLFTAV